MNLPTFSNLQTIIKKRRSLLITLAFIIIIPTSYYTYTTYFNSTEAAATYYTIEAVSRGDVSSGIETTGTIKAAEKLDINVYKQQSRIDTVNVSSGGHVDAGKTIVSFDKSDAYVTSASAKTSATEAALNLATAKETVGDPSTTIRSLENSITGFATTVSTAETSLKTAYTDFLNTNLEAVPSKEQVQRLSDVTTPAISGRYTGITEGRYTIEVYASGAESGYSYRVSGLETDTENLVFGKANAVGVRGLKLTFSTDIRSGDTWVINVPNITIATYGEAKTAYETKVASLQKTIADAKTDKSNAEQNLENTKTTDGTSYRSLTVAKAESGLQEANQKLRDAYKVIQDRSIVAPFSGTVEGMENVVAGATPTGGTNDPINLGTLVSDTFVTTFTLSAADVAKIAVGDNVNVTVTSYTDNPSYQAKVTHIDSLPSSDSVPQYTVEAELTYNHATATQKLREGMLANITVIKSEKKDVLRVPTGAITYKEGKPYLTLIADLTNEQKDSITNLGIVKTTTSPLGIYEREVTLGTIGSAYVEVSANLTEGEYIVTTSLSDTATASVVKESGPGRPPESNSSQSANTKSN